MVLFFKCRRSVRRAAIICGAFFIGGRPCLARIANARIARTIAPVRTAHQRIAIAGMVSTNVRSKLRREVTVATPRILSTKKRRLVSHYRGLEGGEEVPGSLDNQHNNYDPTRLLIPISSRHSCHIRALNIRRSPKLKSCKLTSAAITKGCPDRSIRWAASSYHLPSRRR